MSFASRDKLLCGNRVMVKKRVSGMLDEIEEPTGQIVSMDESCGTAMVKLDEMTTPVKTQLCYLENLPRRFAGTLMKYSSSGIIFKNWRVRYFEVWSNSLTYRPENSASYKGHVQITPKTEIVADIGKPSPPLPYAFGVMNNGRVFRICSDNEQLVEEMKRAIQDCINDAVVFMQEN